MQRVLSPVRVYSDSAIRDHRPIEQYTRVSPARRSVQRVEYAASPVRYVVLNEGQTINQIPTRVITSSEITRAKSIGSTSGLRRSGYVVRDALPTTMVVGQPVEIIELPQSEVRQTYVSRTSPERYVSSQAYAPERYISSEAYVPVSYASIDSARRLELPAIRTQYIDYASPKVQISGSRYYEPRRVLPVDAPVSSYRRALSPVPESRYHSDIARLFADIKEPRKNYAEDIGKLFTRYGSTTKLPDYSRVGDLFSRTILSAELDDKLQFDVDSAVRRILEKTRV